MPFVAAPPPSPGVALRAVGDLIDDGEVVAARDYVTRVAPQLFAVSALAARRRVGEIVVAGAVGFTAGLVLGLIVAWLLARRASDR